MTLLTLLAALGLDYYRPLTRPSGLDNWLGTQAAWLRDHLDAGATRHGWFAWAVGALLPAAIAGMCSGLIQLVSTPLTWAMAVVTLYFATGYRQVAQIVQDMVGAMTVQDMERARRFCGDWCALSPGTDAEGLAVCGIRAVFRFSLERLFGALFWFIILDLFGAVVYALSRALAEAWRDDSSFGMPAHWLVHWLDWLPARGLAISFAVVGNFEHALVGWRGLAGNATNVAVVTAVGGGAIGVHIGSSAAPTEPSHPGSTFDLPGTDYLEGALHLVWRALLLWLTVLALVWLAGR